VLLLCSSSALVLFLITPLFTTNGTLVVTIWGGVGLDTQIVYAVHWVQLADDASLEAAYLEGRNHLQSVISRLHGNATVPQLSVRAAPTTLASSSVNS
jgi:ABC-type polysaccharide transport system permease subunit